MDLRTQRLLLRRPTPADVDVIFAIHSDPRACEHNPSDMLADRASAEELYLRWDGHWERNGFGYWVARPSGGGEPIGFCGLKVMLLREREILNLFYRYTPSAWGNGVAKEAATAVVGWALANVPDRSVIARVRPDNVASQRVAEAAGLHRAPDLDTPGEDGLDWIWTS